MIRRIGQATLSCRPLALPDYLAGLGPMRSAWATRSGAL